MRRCSPGCLITAFLFSLNLQPKEHPRSLCEPPTLPPSSSVLLTFPSVPGAPCLKSPGRGGGRVPAQYAEVTATPETSSRRPGFSQLLPPSPRSFAQVHLAVCRGRLLPEKRPEQQRRGQIIHPCGETRWASVIGVAAQMSSNIFGGSSANSKAFLLGFGGCGC